MIEAKFKHTDIGLVPEDWEVSTFGKEFKKLNAASYTWSETFKDGSCAYLHYGEIHTKYHDHLDVQHSDLPFISKDQAERFNKLQNGDLIMLNASEDYDGVNDCVEIINCDKELIAGQHTIPLRPISDKLTKGFIGYIPSIPAVRMQLIENAVGTKVYGVTNEMLQTVLLPIPTRHEQRRIASALMKVDAIISNLDKLIQKKQAIKKGAMQELLTGRKRLPGFKGEWKERRLGDIFDIKAGGDVDKEHFSITQNNVYKYPVYSNSFVNHGLYGFTSLPKYESNSITITGRGYLGHSEYRNIPFDAVVRILVLSPKYHVDCYLVSEIINFIHPFILESTSIPQLTAPQVMETMVYIPTDISEQRAIAHVLSTMDSDISALETKRDKYRQIKQGMMRDLLTGRIRLVETSDMERKSYTVSVQKNLFDGAIAAEQHPD